MLDRDVTTVGALADRVVGHGAVSRGVALYDGAAVVFAVCGTLILAARRTARR